MVLAPRRAVVELSEQDARTVAYLLGALARERRIYGRPVPNEVDALQRRIEKQVLTVTRSRQPAKSTQRQSEAMEHVGTEWVAARLAWSRSKVLRNHSELDGEIVGGAYVYPRATVERIAHEQKRTQTQP